MKKHCVLCGAEFETEGTRAIYCSDCKAIRKKDADRRRYVLRSKRKYISDTVRTSKRIGREKRYVPEMLDELGLSGMDPTYFEVWKIKNPKEYKAWMKEHLSEDEGKV